jgi:mono/diheme cytochrome c family protein
MGEGHASPARARYARESARRPGSMSMKSIIHTSAMAWIAAPVLLCMTPGLARAQDFSTYSGAQLYARFCASCHGAKGYGDGPVASSFKVIVPDLTRIALRHGGTFPDEQISKIIDGRKTLPPHGSRDMPVWGLEFQALDAGKPQPQQSASEIIARLTAYVRSLQQK